MSKKCALPAKTAPSGPRRAHGGYMVRKLGLEKTEQLDALSRAAGELYSRTVATYWRILRKTGNGKNGRKPVFLSQFGMEKLCMSSELHAHTSDAIVGNFYSSIKSANERKKKGALEAKYPRRRKYFFKITWKSAAIRLKDKMLTLSNGKGNEKLCIPWAFKLPLNVEIGWKRTGGYELRAVYPDVQGVALGEGVAAIDQGELRTATVYDGERSTIYSGRLVRSKARYRAKSIASLDAKISKTRKGRGAVKPSRRRKQLITTKRKLTRKLDNQIRDIQHKQSAHLVSTLYNRGVQTVVIGDIRDIRKSMSYGAKANQKLHGWSFGRFRQMVEYKSKRAGMATMLIDEAYTSQTCPQCTKKYKPKGRVYRCRRCGFESDRDAVGAMNIRAKYLDSLRGVVWPAASVPKDGKPVVGVMAPPVRGVRFKAHFSRHLESI